MEKEIDIYADLPNFNVNDQEKELERLTEKNKLLESELQDLRNQLLDSDGVNKRLENNISSLIKTAKAEISRKERMISDLRTQLDNFSFRRNKVTKFAELSVANTTKDYQKTTAKENNLSNNYVASNQQNNYIQNEYFCQNNAPSNKYSIEHQRAFRNSRYFDDDLSDSDEKDNTKKINKTTLYGERLRKKLLEEKLIQEEQTVTQNNIVPDLRNKIESCAIDNLRNKNLNIVSETNSQVNLPNKEQNFDTNNVCDRKNINNKQDINKDENKKLISSSKEKNDFTLSHAEPCKSHITDKKRINESSIKDYKGKSHQKDFRRGRSKSPSNKSQEKIHSLSKNPRKKSISPIRYHRKHDEIDKSKKSIFEYKENKNDKNDKKKISNGEEYKRYRKYDETDKSQKSTSEYKENKNDKSKINKVEESAGYNKFDETDKTKKNSSDYKENKNDKIKINDSEEPTRNRKHDENDKYKKSISEHKEHKNEKNKINNSEEDDYMKLLLDYSKSSKRRHSPKKDYSHHHSREYQKNNRHRSTTRISPSRNSQRSLRENPRSNPRYSIKSPRRSPRKHKSSEVQRRSRYDKKENSKKYTDNPNNEVPSKKIKYENAKRCDTEFENKNEDDERIKNSAKENKRKRDSEMGDKNNTKRQKLACFDETMITNKTEEINTKEVPKNNQSEKIEEILQVNKECNNHSNTEDDVEEGEITDVSDNESHKLNTNESDNFKIDENEKKRISYEHSSINCCKATNSVDISEDTHNNKTNKITENNKSENKEFYYDKIVDSNINSSKKNSQLRSDLTNLETEVINEQENNIRNIKFHNKQKEIFDPTNLNPENNNLTNETVLSDKVSDIIKSPIKKNVNYRILSNTNEVIFNDKSDVVHKSNNNNNNKTNSQHLEEKTCEENNLSKISESKSQNLCLNKMKVVTDNNDSKANKLLTDVIINTSPCEKNSKNTNLSDSNGNIAETINKENDFNKNKDSQKLPENNFKKHNLINQNKFKDFQNIQINPKLNKFKIPKKSLEITNKLVLSDETLHKKGSINNIESSNSKCKPKKSPTLQIQNENSESKPISQNALSPNHVTTDSNNETNLKLKEKNNVAQKSSLEIANDTKILETSQIINNPTSNLENHSDPNISNQVYAKKQINNEHKNAETLDDNQKLGNLNNSTDTYICDKTDVEVSISSSVELENKIQNDQKNESEKQKSNSAFGSFRMINNFEENLELEETKLKNCVHNALINNEITAFDITNKLLNTSGRIVPLSFYEEEVACCNITQNENKSLNESDSLKLIPTVTDKDQQYQLIESSLDKMFSEVEKKSNSEEQIENSDEIEISMKDSDNKIKVQTPLTNKNSIQQNNLFNEFSPTVNNFINFKKCLKIPRNADRISNSFNLHKEFEQSDASSDVETSSDDGKLQIYEESRKNCPKKRTRLQNNGQLNKKISKAKNGKNKVDKSEISNKVNKKSSVTRSKTKALKASTTKAVIISLPKRRRPVVLSDSPSDSFVVLIDERKK